MNHKKVCAIVNTTVRNSLCCEEPVEAVIRERDGSRCNTSQKIDRNSFVMLSGHGVLRFASTTL